MMEVPQGDTYIFCFTTRAFATGIPTTLAGTPALTVKEEANDTLITTGVTVDVDTGTAAVTGLHEASIVATSGNGYEVGKYYTVYISTGTVATVSVVGEVVGHFRCVEPEGVAGLKEVNCTSWNDVLLATTNPLPNAADGAAGGLPTDSTGKTSFNDIAATAIVSSGAITTSGGAVSTVTAVTNDVGITQAGADKAWSTTSRVLTASTNFNDIAAGDVWAVDATTQQTQGTFGQAIGDPVADTTTIYQAVATDAAGDNVSIDVVAVKAETALIVADTNELQVDWVDAGRLDALLDAIKAVTDSIGATGTGLSAIPWNAAWDAEVESEVIDALDAAISELSQGVPSSTPGLRNAVMLMYMALRNKLDVQTSATDALEIHNDAGTQIAIKLLTDDGSDYSEAKMTTGV